jgi:hypothetical protein
MILPSRGMGRAAERRELQENSPWQKRRASPRNLAGREAIEGTCLRPCALADQKQDESRANENKAQPK